MKKTFTIILFFIAKFSFAQNLVPNPSFEIFDTCPVFFSNESQIIHAVGWSSYSITPDYYNSCAPDTAPLSGSVPFNYLGFQYARTGNAYAGIIVFDKGISNEREYIGIELTQPLIQGNRYYGSFYVSKSDIYGQNHIYTMAANKIGIQLSTIHYSESSPAPTDNHAQIYSDSIIKDTLNWIRISGSFVADSAYRYLIIGNFFVDSLTSYMKLDSVAQASYYYIDDVYLSDTPDSNSDGIATIDNNNFIKIIPNPARDWIVFEGRSGDRFFLFDILGKICFVGEVSPSSLVKIDVSGFTKGIYFFQVQTSKGNITKKIIIQ